MPPLPFDALCPQPDDSLLVLIGEVRRDPRAGKVDLGVGVYRDADGSTPVLRAVKIAEARLLETQATKGYVGPAGDLDFLSRMWDLVAASAVPAERVAALQTVGGSGALRLAAELLRLAGSGCMLVGEPTWPNHAGILAGAGLPIRTYRFFDVATQTVLFDRMMAALQAAQPGDAALLHGSCHNPTGAALSPAQWDEIADVLAARGIVPLIDLAYQGFGRGLAEDAFGLRHVLARVPEALVAVSASKTFGLYRERTGALYAVAASARSAGTVGSHLQGIARAAYSMPPDHGAAIVRTILADEPTRAIWVEELTAMRSRLMSLRTAFANSLGTIRPDLRRLGDQEGMFSLLEIDESHVEKLKNEHAIYMPASGRINIAGLREDQIDAVAHAVLGRSVEALEPVG